MVTAPLLALALAGCAEKETSCMEGYEAVGEGSCAPIDDGDGAAGDDGEAGDSGDDGGGDDGAGGGGDDTAPPADTGPAGEALIDLDAPRLLRRMSLDLVGELPEVAALDAVEADPALLDGYRDALLDDPRFEERLADLLAERWHTRVDDFEFFYNEYEELRDDPANEYPWERSVADEPLRLMAFIAANDRPWAEILTADYTLANELLAEIWPVDYPNAGRPGGSGWQVSTWNDGRPAAGVLSSSGLWTRHYTTLSNYNRGRMATIFRLLVCEDILARPISLSQSTDVGAASTEDALRQDPYCMGCHSSLDPAAASLFGFWVTSHHNKDDVTTYHPEREPLGEELLGVQTEWFGVPISGLQDLGQAIAADSRFSSCVAESMAEAYWRRAPTVEEFDELQALRQSYLDGGERLKPLIRAVMDTESYRAGALGDGASEDQLEREVVVRMLSPDQLAGTVASLTGFTWTWDGFEQLHNDSYGYRVLAGGVDGVYQTRPQLAPGATWNLVLQRVSQAAAQTAIEQGAPLLDGVDLDAAPDEATLSALHWRLYARRADAGWLADAGALWAAVEAGDSAEAAWTSLLSVMLRDPDFVTY